MSARMITGDGDFTVIDGGAVGVRPGLGLVLAHPQEREIGIDEDTALLVTAGRYAEVVGRGPVVLVDAEGPDRLEMTLLRAGRMTDLRQRP